MKKHHVPPLFILIAMLVSACQQNKPFTEGRALAANPPTESTSDALMIPCVAPTEGTKAWGIPGSFWVNKHDFNVRFLNSDTAAHEKVKRAVKAWEDVANIHFHWIDSGNADIRIGFDTSEGHWSKVGTSAKGVPQSEKTMNIGLTGRDSQSEFNRVARHEFGHALGLQHEHQHPAFKIDWNKDKVYAWYAKAPNYWEPKKVDSQVFALYTGSYTGTAPDKNSIMEYPILPGWAKNISVGWNHDLSPLDKQFIAQKYGPPQPTADWRRLDSRERELAVNASLVGLPVR